MTIEIGSQNGGGVPLYEGGTHAEHSRPNEKHGTQRGLQDSSRMQLLGGVAFFGGDFSQSSENLRNLRKFERTQIFCHTKSIKVKVSNPGNTRGM